jgi:release factor glutamine methyltransferase
VLEWTTGHLKKHGSDTPRLDAEILLAFARGCQRIQLYTAYDETLTDAIRGKMRELVQRRAQAEPVAYLVGHREFFSLDFRVTKDVLIPRPDTETLVIEIIEGVKQLAAARHD